jgi:excisionase family DNA binding protein
MPKKYVRTPEVAEYTGLSTHTIKAYVLNRKIPFIKVNGCVLFNLAEIDDWLQGNRVEVSGKRSNDNKSRNPSGKRKL